MDELQSIFDKYKVNPSTIKNPRDTDNAGVVDAWGTFNSDLGITDTATATTETTPVAKNKDNKFLNPKETLSDLGGFIDMTRQSSQKRADNIQASQEAYNRGEQNLAETVLQKVGQGLGGGADAIGNLFTTAAKALVPQTTEEDFARGLDIWASKVGKNKAVQDLAQKAISMYDQLPENQKRNIDAAGGIVSLATEFIGGGVAGKATTEAATTAKEAVGSTVKKVVSNLDTIAKQQAEAAAGTIDNLAATTASNQKTKAVKATIEAIDPTLTGKKAQQAYKEVVTGGRDVNKPGVILKGQSLTPNQRTIKVAERMSSDITTKSGDTVKAVKLGKDEIKNLNNLNTSLTETEAQIQKLIKGDPEFKFNADKPTLFEKLDTIKKEAPLEFRSIKDDKARYEAVFEFAKNIVNKADDSIEGLRSARTSFDTEARKQFPSVFKDGAIDTSTPAGRAIKDARDALNDHLYDTAPDGSDIKALIGRESDILYTAEEVALRASKGQGKTKAMKLLETIKANPLRSAIGGYVGAKAIESATGIDVPLL